MKPRGYRGECGQCDFIATSAIKMEQHLLTHGIVLNSSLTSAEGEAPKPRPRKRKGRKRASYQVKVEVKVEEVEPIQEENDSNAKLPDAAGDSCVVNEKPQPEEVAVAGPGLDDGAGDKLVPGNDSKNCMLLFTEESSRQKKVIKNENLPLTRRAIEEQFKDSQTEEMAMGGEISLPSLLTNVRVENVLPVSKMQDPQALPQVHIQAVTEISPQALPSSVAEETVGHIDDEAQLHLTLSDVDTSNSSSQLMNNSLMDSSGTLSLPDDEFDAYCVSPELKKEPVDPSYEKACANAVPTTPKNVPVSPSAVVTKTPPDHDYIQSEPEPSTVEDGYIPDSLKEEFVMNCMSIKQEEFDKMCSSAEDDTESGVIVIAPSGTENEMNELRSWVGEQCSDGVVIKTEKADSNENYRSDAQPSSPSAVANLGSPTGVNLIKTSVLKSILSGKVRPPGTTPSPTKEQLAKDSALSGRKMYSLPCMFTSEGKLRLVPASSQGISHYIVVAPATAGRQPCLFLVAKSKVQNVGPRTAYLQTSQPAKPAKPPVKRKLGLQPSAKLKKARSELNSILAKAHGTEPSAPNHESNHESSRESNSESNRGDGKTFICRKQLCSFRTKQYYAYQSHVMHCWQDHGFMVCCEESCEGSFRTKSAEEFKRHCRYKHPSISVHYCSKCMYLASSPIQITYHQAMYHQDLYAPETPFPALPTTAPKAIAPRPRDDFHQKTSPPSAVKNIGNLAANLQSSEAIATAERTMSLSLSNGLGGITNATVNVVNKGTYTCVPKHSVTISPAAYNPQSPQKVTPSKLASKKIRELLAQKFTSSTASSDVKDVCFSSKKLEETLEPAAKLLTETVQAKCLHDLEENFHQKNFSPQPVVYIKQEPGSSEESAVLKKPIVRDVSGQHDAATDKNLGLAEKAVVDLAPKNVCEEPSGTPGPKETAMNNGQEGSSTKDAHANHQTDVAQESQSVLNVNLPEKPNSSTEEDFQDEYFDGTVDESFVFDEDIDQNATAEDLFSEEFAMQGDVNATNSCEKRDTASPEDLPSDDSVSRTKDSLSPSSNVVEVKKLMMEDKNGSKSEVLLQLPRQSQRVPKPNRMYFCSDSCPCCSNDKRRRARRKLRQELSVVSQDQVVDMKLSSKPAVVLIDIMSLVKPMLGLNSPKYSRKQTARKSTAKRSRIVKKSHCSCCTDK